MKQRKAIEKEYDELNKMEPGPAVLAMRQALGWVLEDCEGRVLAPSKYLLAWKSKK
jgi:hypothetical protein